MEKETLNPEETVNTPAEEAAPVEENAPVEETAPAEEAAPVEEKAAAPAEMKRKDSRVGLIVLCVCALAVLLLIAAKFVSGAKAETPAPAETAAEEAQPEATAEPIEIPSVDYDRLYALHAPDEVVAAIGGEDVTWDEYFCWLYMNAGQVESFFQQVATNYGTELKWTDSYSDEQTYSGFVISATEQNISRFIAIEKAAADMGFVKDAEFEAALKEQREGDIATVCGEGASEEEFFAKLSENRMTRAGYERMSSANAVYSQAFMKRFGEQFEKVETEDIIDFLNENEFMYATHILLMTTGDDGAALDDDAKAERRQQLETLRAELSAIEDSDALVARFKELKEEYDEDTGKAAYPDGYMFTPGEMVPEFENAVLALDDYGLSDIVETTYGYHLILRLPLDTEAAMGYNDDGTTYSARVAYANEKYTGAIADALDAIEVRYADGFEIPNITDYLTA